MGERHGPHLYLAPARAIRQANLPPHLNEGADWLLALSVSQEGILVSSLTGHMAGMFFTSCEMFRLLGWPLTVIRQLTDCGHFVHVLLPSCVVSFCQKVDSAKYQWQHMYGKVPRNITLADKGASRTLASLEELEQD